MAFLAAAQGVLWYLQCPGYDNLFEPDVQGVAAVAKDRRNRVGLEVAHFGSESYLFFKPGDPDATFELGLELMLLNSGAFAMKLVVGDFQLSSPR